MPWAVKFNNYPDLRHPVQLYQFFYYILIFIILFNLRKLKNKKDGLLFYSFLILDSLFRFITEFFKDLPKDYGFFYLGLNLAQWFSILIFIVGLIGLYRTQKP